MTVPPPASIAILGGGTAGWMTACLMAAAWPDSQISLIESPEIGIIGVGEGSTPQMRAFFRRLGLDDADWMPRCNATYKTGIRFAGWSQRPGFERYFHPFVTALDGQTLSAFTYNTRARRTGRDVWAHPDRFFLPAALAAAGKAPIPAENFPFDVSYGYHFDAHLVGQVLRDHAVGQGVTHLLRHVQGVMLAPDGSVAALAMEGDESLAADLFVDCSGFAGRIHQQAMAVPFKSYADTLFNDRAVVLPTANPDGPLLPETRSTALSAGWAWAIPLTSRTGNGYVFASDFLSADTAEAELRAHLGLLDSPIEARHMTMRVGRVAETWVRNSLAVGLAQGFIEPLEATALHIVHATVEGFIAAWADGARDAFNDDIARRYDGIRDYITCHYRVNQRADSDYWRANAANQALSDELKTILTAWYRGADLTAVLAETGLDDIYPSLSWHCLLAGYGTYPDDSKLSSPGPDITRHDMAGIDDFIRRCALNFPDHRAMLQARAIRQDVAGC